MFYKYAVFCICAISIKISLNGFNSYRISCGIDCYKEVVGISIIAIIPFSDVAAIWCR